MTRADMIRELIDATLAAALTDPAHGWLRGMLAQGFAGYEKMSTASLEHELRLRGLLEFDEPEPLDEFDDEEDEDDEMDESLSGSTL